MTGRRAHRLVRKLRVAGLIAAFASPAAAQQLSLPFAGRWFVLRGADSSTVNDQVPVTPPSYGLDFAKAGDPGQRALSRPGPTKLEDYYSWGAPVLAPADGDIVSLVDTLPDNAVGLKDASNPFGNNVILRVAPDRYVVLAHLQRGTVGVKIGTHVKRGEPLAHCGNSGDSDFPRIHMHLQDSPTLNVGSGQNSQFAGINIDVSGKQFDHVDWPLIRGLFVSNP
jgi:hypothetical protein